MSHQPSNRNQFVWEVKQFTSYSQKPGVKLKSHIFNSINLFETEWKLVIEIGSSQDPLVSVYLKRCRVPSDTGPKDLFLQMEISVLDTAKKEHFQHYMKCNFQKGRKRGFANIAKRSRIVGFRNSLLNQGNLTVQCCVWKCVPNEIQPLVSRVSANVNVEYPTFDWTITCMKEWNFNDRRNISLLSDIIPNGFELYGTLKQELDEEGLFIDVIDFEIDLMACIDKQVLIAGTLSFRDCFGGGRMILTGQTFFEVGANRTWHLGRVYKRDLFDPKKHLVDYNTLVIRCEFLVADGKQATRARDGLSCLVDVMRNTSKTLLNDLKQVPINSSFPDIQLKVGNELFPAHRLILSARSAVFLEVLKKAEHKLISRRTSTILESDSPPRKTRRRVLSTRHDESYSDVDPLLPLEDSESDAAAKQEKVQMRCLHRALSLKSSQSDSYGKNVHRNYKHQSLPSPDSFSEFDHAKQHFDKSECYQPHVEESESNKINRESIYTDSSSEDSSLSQSSSSDRDQTEDQRNVCEEMTQNSTDSEPENVQISESNAWTSTIYESDSAPRTNRPKVLSTRHDESGSDVDPLLELDDFVSDTFAKQEKVQMGCLPLTFSLDVSQSYLFDKSVHRNCGHQTLPSPDLLSKFDHVKQHFDKSECYQPHVEESESNKINRESIFSDSSSEDSSRSQSSSSNRNQTEDQRNVDGKMSQNSTDSEPENAQTSKSNARESTYGSPETWSLDIPTLQRVELVSDNARDSTDKSSLPPRLDDYSSQPGIIETEEESDILVSSKDITILIKDGECIAEISGMSIYTLQQMLKCMYTDCLDDMELKEAVELYKVGVKYRFPLLKEKTESILISSIKMYTLFYLLETADSVSMLKLKEATFNFIEQNWVSISTSDEWLSFVNKYKDLGAETLDYIRNKKKK